MQKPGLIEKLKHRWKVRSAWHVAVILLVFTCTGFTVLLIKSPLLTWLPEEEGSSTLASVLYYVFILPLYNVLLLGYGFVFGQFRFFWQFEKRMVERFFSLLRRKK